MINVYEAADANKRKSAVVVILFAAFIGIATYFIAGGFSAYYGYEAGGLGIVGIALIFSGVLTFFSYYFSDKIVLSISKAKPANKKDHYKFFTVAENLAIGAGIPRPKLFVINDTATNAFATGRNPEKAVVCVTTGLLDKLTRTELEGVIAHEMSHIKNYDIRLMSLVSVMVGSVALLADIFLRARWLGGSRRNNRSQAGSIIVLIGFLFAILSPLIANLIKLAISRRREFMADVGSVSITRQPSGLISALKKISKDKEPLEVANKATAHLYIANPFKGKRHGAVATFSKLFNTHPQVSERIKVLQKMS